MCFQINQQRESIEKLIAQEDITVFKATSKTRIDHYKFASFWRDGFIYHANMSNERIELKITKSSHLSIITYDSNPDKYLNIDNGYHSWTNLSSIQMKVVCVFTFEEIEEVGVFKIPKGTTYYTNQNGEAVSSNLIYLGMLSKELLDSLYYVPTEYEKFNSHLIVKWKAKLSHF